MKKLFALLAVLALALTLTPVLTANAAVAPEQKLEVTEVNWGTEKSFGIGTATSPVVQVKGKITGVTDLNTASLNIYRPPVATATAAVATTGLARAGSVLNLSTGDFTLYVDFTTLMEYGDGAYKVWYLTSATTGIVDDAPITLGVFTTKEAVPSEVTSGQKVTITGTGTLRNGSAFPSGYSAYEIVIWKNVSGTPTITATAPLNFVGGIGTATTVTFDFSFNAYGPVGTEYYFTVQDANTDTDYHGATYFTVKVTKEAELTVKPSPSTIMAGATTNVELSFTANGVALSTNVVTVTITLGNVSTVTIVTTTADGKAPIPVNFANPGVATVEAKATGPVYGKGSTTIAVQRAVPQEAIDVEWPTTWVIGQDNTIILKTPLDGYTINELKVKISGPVLNAETITATSSTSTVSFDVFPVGYGVLSLEVTGTITNGTPLKVSKTFVATIPGYVATVDPEELVRGATQTITVVVKDPYGNPVNNALVQLFSPTNDAANAIAELNGTATTVVNNGTYKLVIPAAKVANADEDAYIKVTGIDSNVKAYAPVTILPSEDVKVTLEKTEIVLGPKTTLTVTVASPVSLQGAKITLIDPEDTVDPAIFWMFTDTATLQKVVLTIDEMPKYGAGVYTIVVEPVDKNHVGSATVAFVGPKFSASPSEIVAGSTVVVTVTSANVSDLKSVVDIVGEGVTVKSITTSTESITATLVAGTSEGTATLTFKFDSGYDKATLNLSVVYGKLTVENATIAFGTKVLAFTPVNAAGATLAVGTEVKINLLGNEYSGYVAADGSVSILIPELPMGTYSVLVKVAGYQDATFSVVVAEAKPEYETIIELAPGMDIYTVNGETKFWDATPYIKNGRTMVPIRHLAEAVGFQADWDFEDPANKMVFIFTADQDPETDKEHPFILLIIGQPTAMVSGNLVALDVAPEILNGRTMVPLRFVVETLGYQVEWLGNNIRLMK
jgi:hypothetical protein